MVAVVIGLEPLLCESCLIAGSKQLRLAVVEARADGHATPTHSPTVRALVHHASQIGGVPEADILGKRRAKKLVTQRKAIVWVAKRATHHSYPMIGRALGGRDHSTIIHSERSAEDMCERDLKFAWFCERLWAAGECAPVEPLTLALPEPVEEPEQPSVAVAVRFVEPVLPVATLRTVPGEYIPKNALPPVMAVIGYDPTTEKDAEDNHLSPSIEWGSAALLAAMRREHPDRCAA